MIAIADKIAIKEYFDSLSSEEIVLTISHLGKDDRSELFALLSPTDAAGFIEEIPEVQATDILERLSSQNAAAIMNELKSNDQADLMVEFRKESAEAIMAEMKPEDVEKVRRLIEYNPDTAGGLMITEFLAFDESMKVRDVTEHLRNRSEEYTRYNVQYIYVTEQNRFAGVCKCGIWYYPSLKNLYQALQ
ncbi:MAG: hypothetical protein O2887_12350 [Bacteroidetes bacterium]|nr:hypothetical protein [Bacteroidota bacterium]MDA1121261.1 hypothetical protein [Bacteroidota bacterium]